MRGGLAFLAFTDRGFALAQKLAEALGGSAARCGRPDSLGEWTKRHFAQAGGLVYVGAVGIAVRAIAPYVGKKWEDPAVVAVDECANFCRGPARRAPGGRQRPGPGHRPGLRRKAGDHHRHRQ